MRFDRRYQLAFHPRSIVSRHGWNAGKPHKHWIVPSVPSVPPFLRVKGKDSSSKYSRPLELLPLLSPRVVELESPEQVTRAAHRLVNRTNTRSTCSASCAGHPWVARTSISSTTRGTAGHGLGDRLPGIRTRPVTPASGTAGSVAAAFRVDRSAGIRGRRVPLYNQKLGRERRTPIRENFHDTKRLDGFSRPNPHQPELIN